MNEQNVATLNVAKPSILTIDTAGVYLHLSQPADSIEFNLTYNPNIFSFLPGSVQCALPWKNVDYAKPGIVSFKLKSEDPAVTANVVSFSFRPLMATPLAGFIASGLVTNTGATLTVPTANITVQTTYIYYIPVNPVAPPSGAPLSAPPRPAQPLGAPAPVIHYEIPLPIVDPPAGGMPPAPGPYYTYHPYGLY